MSDLKLTERNGTFYAAGTIAGRRIRQSLGTRDRTIAKQKAAQLEARLWERAIYGEKAVRTFEEAAVIYLEQGGEGRFLPKLLHHFKGRPVAQIEPGEVRDAALRLYPDAGAATRNRQAIVPARAVINAAAEMGWCPAIRIKLFPVAKSRKHTPVDRDWLNAFMAQADKDGLPHLSALVLFMHQTGARRKEAANLLGEHVDLTNRMALLAKTKTSEWDVRHLTAELVLRIAGLKIKDGHPIFRYMDATSINKTMKAVCKRAGIPYRSTHSAGRHSFGTNAMKLPDARVRQVMEAGGWKSARLFMETYVHEDDAGRSIASKMDAETGTIGTEMAQSKNEKRQATGKKGRK